MAEEAQEARPAAGQDGCRRSATPGDADVQNRIKHGTLGALLARLAQVARLSAGRRARLLRPVREVEAENPSEEDLTRWAQRCIGL